MPFLTKKKKYGEPELKTFILYLESLNHLGHLVEKNKRIDTDHPKNKAFLAKFITREVERESSKSEPEEKEEAQEKEGKQKGLNSGNIDYVLKQHDLKLKIVNIEKGRLDVDKKKGKLIEIKAATDVMQRSVVVLSSQYRLESKTFITELASKYNIPNADLAGIQKKFDITINKAVSQSKNLIKKECEIIASEYSETLNRGESKT